MAAEHYPFTQYVRDICEKMTFVSSGSKTPGSELGIFGYFFKLLEMAGYVLGATLPSLIVKGMAYCKACQKYLTKHRTAYFSSPTLWSDVKKTQQEGAVGPSWNRPSLPSWLGQGSSVKPWPPPR